MYFRTVLSALLSYSLSFSAVADDWETLVEAYMWVPTVETVSSDGSSSEISRQTILEDLDMGAMAAVGVTNSRWTFMSDFIYFDISDSFNAPLADGETLKDLALEAWIVTPTIGYRIVNDERNVLEVHAGARYIWIDIGTKVEFSDPKPDGTQQDSDGDSHWDGVVGVVGRYSLSDQWYVPYSANVGAGDSDSTFQLNAGLAYRLQNFDAVLGWRYLDYDFGSDTAVKELKVNGPYAGLVWRF